MTSTGLPRPEIQSLLDLPAVANRHQSFDPAPATPDAVARVVAELRATSPTALDRFPVADVRDLWATWAAIRAPTLVLRGEHSDLLDTATLARMQQDGAAVLTVADCGHAPALMDEPTIAAVRAFLSG